MTSFGGHGDLNSKLNSLSLVVRDKKIIVAVDYGTTFTGNILPSFLSGVLIWKMLTEVSF